MVEERVPRPGGGAEEYMVHLHFAPAPWSVGADSLIPVWVRCVVSKAPSGSKFRNRCDLVVFLTPVPDEVRKSETLKKSMAAAVHTQLGTMVGGLLAPFGADRVDWGENIDTDGMP